MGFRAKPEHKCATIALWAAASLFIKFGVSNNYLSERRLAMVGQQRSLLTKKYLEVLKRVALRLIRYNQTTRLG